MSKWRAIVREEMVKHRAQTESDVIRLAKIYDIVLPRSTREFPDNDNQQAKIRQVLQQLERVNEVDRLNNGEYALDGLDEAKLSPEAKAGVDEAADRNETAERVRQQMDGRSSTEPGESAEIDVEGILEDVLNKADSGDSRTSANSHQPLDHPKKRSGSRVRREEMLEQLQEAAEMVGESPSVRQFNALDVTYSARGISAEFGSWNAAKSVAGLETRRRGSGTRIKINETYFRSLDTPNKVYWLGALMGRSSLNVKNQDSRTLAIVRTKSHAHFVEAFADAVDSEYSISQMETASNEQDRLQLSISNPTFIENLISAGYPGRDDDVAVFPDLEPPLREAFLRGYLESCGYFSTGGWSIKVQSHEQTERFEEWIEGFGVKRVTVSSKPNNASHVIRVSNVFDVRAMFEACWPDLTDTDPCHKLYPEKIFQYLHEEYPYPENLGYLS
jgi:hypothetical protein